MHAASVHPEPGSNSLKNCIWSNYSVDLWFSHPVPLPEAYRPSSGWPGSYPRLCFSPLDIFLRVNLMFSSFTLNLPFVRVQKNCRVPFNTYMFPCSMLVLSSCCSIFNDRFLTPLVAEPDYYITTRSVCQGVFQTFLKFFQIVFPTALELPFSARLAYYTTPCPFCQ